jgi:hypothetical protein
MSLRQSLCRFVLSGILSVFLVSIDVRAQLSPVQDDPVIAANVTSVPAIDGNGDDSCWASIPWQSIEQVWIPYGDTVSPDDYSGRYKVVWSSSTDLLYFLVEVTDDVFVDGFIPDSTSDIYHYDIIEVFIDEDRSGGLHVFDGTDNPGFAWGANAENAFSYHIYAPFPAEEKTTTSCFAGDLHGTRWSDSKTVDYASHFPAFALRKTGHTAVWEFSLIVYNDTYEEEHRDSARSLLHADKIMGLSLAYCDNDNPREEPKTRDNMFGSVYEPPPGNMHWMNADYYGRLRLIGNIPTGMRNGNTISVDPAKPAATPESVIFGKAHLSDRKGVK